MKEILTLQHKRVTLVWKVKAKRNFKKNARIKNDESPLQSNFFRQNLPAITEKSVYRKYEESSLKVEKVKFDPTVAKSISELELINKRLEKLEAEKTIMNADIIEYLKIAFLKHNYKEKHKTNFFSLMSILFGKEVASREKNSFEKDKRDYKRKKEIIKIFNTSNI